MSSTNNVIVLSLTSLGIAVIGVIGALAIWGSASNPMIATATGQIGTILVAMIGALVAFRVGADAKVAAVEAAEVAKVAVTEVIKSKNASRENGQSIAALTEQTSHALEGVNQKVDGHLSELMNEVRYLRGAVATLTQDKAVTKIETAHAIAEAAAAPPPGSTPARGTPITPSSDGDTTTIVISPDSAATIESTAGDPGQAKVGDKQ